MFLRSTSSEKKSDVSLGWVWGVVGVVVWGGEGGGVEVVEEAIVEDRVSDMEVSFIGACLSLSVCPVGAFPMVPPLSVMHVAIVVGVL